MFIGGGAGRERMMFGVEASKPQNIGVTLARFLSCPPIGSRKLSNAITIAVYCPSPRRRPP